MQYADILHRCFRCGYCKLPGDYSALNCPSYLKYRFESYSPGGRMWLLRAWLEGEVRTSSHLAEIFFSCANCANCVEHCVFPKFKDDLLNAFIAGREELVNEGAVPPAVRDYFKAIQINGNPYKQPESERGKWAEGQGLEAYGGQEYLFYVGDVGSYDECGQRMARAVAALLKALGVSFGILGADERPDGNDVRAMGETGLFRFLAEGNTRQFKALGIQKVITLSPHAFNAMKNDYPAFGSDFGVYHYTHILGGLLKGKALRPCSAEIPVTFHDPCYLGRHNEEYGAPRRVLKNLPGVELLEMPRSKADALCCGGGGGNFFTDILGTGLQSPARVRLREAVETGAQVLAVACPKCAKMFDDATKAEEWTERIQVMDLAEMVQRYFGQDL